jgi:hypothetical protein
LRGPVMDKRRSFYLASRQDDFGEPPVDKGWVADIPYVMPANDNVRTKSVCRPTVAFCFVV